MKKNSLLLILTFATIFTLSLQVITDTDFGWHLRVGEHILATKNIPRTDLFSFTQPNYPYVYHSWAAETLIFTSYKLMGLAGVSILFSLVLATSLFFIYKTTLALYGKVNPIIFIWISLLAHPVAGARTRAFGLLFLSIIYFLFVKFEKKGGKSIWLIPPIFTLWVNFHGSFILGIAALGLILAWSLFQKKLAHSQLKTLTSVFVASLFATIVNPYSTRAWQQAVTMSYNSYFNLHKINVDWQPLVARDPDSWILILVCSILIVSIYFFKITKNKLHNALMLSFFTLSLLSSRFIIALFVFITPTANQVVYEVKKRLDSNILKSPALIAPLVIVSLIIPLTIVKNSLEIKSAYSTLSAYSQFLAERSPNRLSFASPSYEAAAYVTNNLAEKRILSEANWSGFLLLLNKNIKLFYWGAMDNYIVNGKSFAFEYQSLISAEDNYQQILAKYGVEVIFLPPYFPLVKKIENSTNWKKVYEDKQAVVLVRI